MRRVLASLGALALVAALASPAAASGATATQWHRLNPTSPPEHERLICVSGAVVRCLYDKLPEPKLGFHWDRTKGVFSGADATASWTCPAWFPPEICDARVSVASGTFTYYTPGAAPASYGADLITLDIGGQPMLAYYWSDFGFVCPWFPSFTEAMANDPRCYSAP